MIAEIVACRTELAIPVAVACRALDVSVSWFYKHRNGQRSSARLRRDELDQAIDKVFVDQSGEYGSPRIHAELVEEHGYDRLSVNTDRSSNSPIDVIDVWDMAATPLRIAGTTKVGVIDRQRHGGECQRLSRETQKPPLNAPAKARIGAAAVAAFAVAMMAKAVAAIAAVRARVRNMNRLRRSSVAVRLDRLHALSANRKARTARTVARTANTRWNLLNSLTIRSSGGG